MQSTRFVVDAAEFRESTSNVCANKGGVTKLGVIGASGLDSTINIQEGID